MSGENIERKKKCKITEFESPFEFALLNFKRYDSEPVYFFFNAVVEG